MIANEFPRIAHLPYKGYQMTSGRYIFASRFCKEKSVLDLGGGTGYGLRFLLGKGAKEGFLGDINKKNLEFASDSYNLSNLIMHDARRLAFKNEVFDVVIAYELIEHVPNPHDIVSECYRVLKDNGILLCSTPNKQIVSPYTKKPFYREIHVKEYTKNEFESLLKKYFKDITLHGQNFLFLDYKMKVNILGRTLKYKIIGFISKLLSLIPLGEGIKNKLRKVISNPANFERIDEELFDDKFRVKEMSTDAKPIPENMLALCKK